VTNTLPTIAIIGSGTMGEAIIAGLLRNQVTTPGQIRATDVRADRLQELHDKYAILTMQDNLEAVSAADGIILAVKPQSLKKVLHGLENKISPDALVISIVAGASIQTLSTGLNHASIIRCMPNTPAQIGEGITVWTPAPAVSQAQRDLTQQILSAFGKEIFVDEENYLDMATALSGTGPAYVFLFLEAMIDAGVHLGFPRWIAEQLVTQTFSGSVDYYKAMKQHPARLRNEVTSPGGTSAAALYYLEKAGFRTALSRAVWAAYERSQELGKGRDSQPPDKKNNE
jgi:pyrroline-5-carboxylate reductase